MKHDNMNEYTLPFAAWELRLYLDTHPEDVAALREYRRICNMSGGKCNYACNTPDARDIPYEIAPYSDHDHHVDNGCGCDTHNNAGGGNYGGNRCDGGNYSPRVRVTRGDVGGCGCGCGQSVDPVRNVWSWIDGPWPWEPEANGGNC